MKKEIKQKTTTHFTSEILENIDVVAKIALKDVANNPENTISRLNYKKPENIRFPSKAQVIQNNLIYLSNRN